MNGSRGRSNNFLLDGTDMNDGYRNDPAINEAGVFGDPATILPIDAVGELRVLSNYEAEYGRNSGAVVNIVTKSGTNQLHGSALEYYRSGALGARNYFNIDSQPKNPFTNNQFGGSLGGPIVKDKAFFFVDYEGQRESGAQAGLSCVPDASIDCRRRGAGRGERHSSQPADAEPAGAQSLAVTQYPGVGQSSTQPDARCGPNLATSTRFCNNVDSVIAKVDYNPNTNNNITGRYYYGNSNQSFPFAQLAGGLLPGFNTVTPTTVQLVSLSWVKVVNSSQVNEARLGWNRFVEGFFPEDQSFDPASIGLDTGVTSSYNYGLPKISVGGFSVIGATASVPRNRVDSNWHFIDNYSWQIGPSRFQVRLRIPPHHDQPHPGQQFPRQAELRRPSPAVSRRTAVRRQPGVGLHQPPRSGEQPGLYVQDSFRWTTRLTVNYGLRWDYFGVPSEKNNLFYQLTPANGGTLVQVGADGGPSSLYNKDYNNFAPRIAVLLRPDRQGRDRHSRRMGHVLRRVLAGHLPRPRSLQLHLLSRSRLHGSWRRADRVRRAERERHCPGHAGVRGIFAAGQLLRRRSQHPHALRAELEPEYPAADHQQDHAAAGLRGIEGHQAVPLPRHQSAQPGADHVVSTWRSACRQMSRRTARLQGFDGRDGGIQRAANCVSELLLRESGGVLGELDLQRAAGQPAHEWLAWTFAAGQLRVVALHR